MSEAPARPPGAGRRALPARARRPWPRPTSRPRSSRPSTRAGWPPTSSRPDGAGSRARLTADALRRHHAAAQRDRRPPPGSRGPLGDRGPHGPAGTHAAATDALAAGRRPRLDRRPVGAAPRARRRGHHARGPRPGALPRAHVALHGGDAPGHHGPAAPPGHLGRLGPRALHDGRALGAGRARRLQAALRGRPRLPRPEARQLVPGLRHERLRPRGHRDARRRARSGRSAITSCRRARAPGADAQPRRDDHRGHHAAGDDPRATRPWPCTRTTRATRRSSVAPCASPSSTGTCPSSPTPSWSATSAPAP